MNKIISQLYFDYQQTEDYTREFKNSPHLDDVHIAEETFVNPTLKKDFKAGDRLDTILTSALGAAEDFGFEQGFKYAMRLRNECNISVLDLDTASK